MAMLPKPAPVTVPEVLRRATGPMDLGELAWWTGLRSPELVESLLAYLEAGEVIGAGDGPEPRWTVPDHPAAVAGGSVVVAHPGWGTPPTPLATVLSDRGTVGVRPGPDYDGAATVILTVNAPWMGGLACLRLTDEEARRLVRMLTEAATPVDGSRPAGTDPVPADTSA
ncbi:hypothetical protein Ga0074812_14925 [Parafrankia irregularis]|uniref:Uncharacterized protein n=2 Tax=Frankiales TaxID=85013 RepID=A0A0S4QZ01_9ACTN|nr:hypothetical protein Ga0074812_14925 [Parafrankia irregularis]